MKKGLMILSMVAITHLFAEPKMVGEASDAGRNAANWRNWAFAGGAVVLATTGLVVLGWDKGTSAHE